MTRKHAQRPQSVSLLIAGAGLIGSFLAPLLALLPGVGRIRIIDRERYDESNRAQCLPGDIGKVKSFVLADKIRQLNPAIVVEPVHADLENVPLGFFRCDVILAGLDSKRARRHVNEVAWRMGVPWIDAGVNGSSSLARVTAFVPGPKVACYECSMDDADYASEQVYPCQPAGPAPTTNAPAYLGALVAALQTAACARLINGTDNRHQEIRELLYDCHSRRLLETRISRRPSCRFDHKTYSMKQLDAGPRKLTLAQALSLGQRARQNGSDASLHVPGKVFVRRLICECGHMREITRLQGRLSSAHLTCRKCGHAMAPLGFHSQGHLTVDDLTSAKLTRSLSKFGFMPSDVFGVTRKGRTTLYELKAS